MARYLHTDLHKLSPTKVRYIDMYINHFNTLGYKPIITIDGDFRIYKYVDENSDLVIEHKVMDTPKGIAVEYYNYQNRSGNVMEDIYELNLKEVTKEEWNKAVEEFRFNIALNELLGSK